jgi:hypothetical protein
VAQRGPPGDGPKPDAWRLLARKRALRYVGPSLLVVSDQAHVEGVIDDVAIVVDTCMESSRDRFALHTRVTGRAVAPLPMRMAVQSRSGQAEPPEGALQGLGEPDFDQRFSVKAAPAGPARSLLGEDVRVALLRFPEPLVLMYAHGEARLFWEGRERELETLETAADIVLATCRFRAAGGYR